MDGAPRTLDVVEVLTRARESRDELLALVDYPELDLDSHLVSDVLRASGRVGAALRTRPALVELCAVLRAMDAAIAGRIDLNELRAGIEAHAARTNRFEAFHDARVLLRTLDDVLEPARIAYDARATTSQVELIHGQLQEWMVDQLVGTSGVQAEPLATPRDARSAFEVLEPELRGAAHELVEELLYGARDHPVTGLLGAAWRRDWSAVPIASERFGENPAQVDRLAETLAAQLPNVTHVLQVERHRPPRWAVRGRELLVNDGLRRAWRLPASRDGIALAAIEERTRAVITTPELEFAIVEGVDHHALLGPMPFVEAVLGVPPLHAIAAFREHVESLADDGDDPPEHLLEVATNFGRLRRRSR